MKLGFAADSRGNLSFQAVLDHAVRIGVSGVEVNTGGWSTAPHFDLATMKSSAEKRRSFLHADAIVLSVDEVQRARSRRSIERSPACRSRKAALEP